MKIRADFNWKLTLFVVLFLPLLIRLGFWQLDRAEEKRQILHEHQLLVDQPAVPYGQVNKDVAKNYLNISVQGKFGENYFLLDNQVYKGKFGYEVIQPLVLASGEIMLVSRGWIAGSLDRRQLPAVEMPAGTVQLEGYLYQPQGAIQLDAKTWAAEGWPKVIQAADVEKMYKALGDNAKIRSPFLLRLRDGQPLLLTAHWQIVNVRPERHTAYAYQWFGMALLLVILYIVASIKRNADDSAKD